MPIAIITGASKGLGFATARALAQRGWSLIIDAQHATALEAAHRELASEAAAAGAGGRIIAITGDVANAGHRAQLANAVHDLGGLELLINNASYLGPSPQPGLAEYPLAELARVYEVNVFAPLALTQLVIGPLGNASGIVVSISSDAAVEAYEGWGGYGSAKAALDQLTAVLGAEQAGLRAYAFDPGDMRTDMAQQAYPGHDISDRPMPATVVPALLELIGSRPPSGRYLATQFTQREVLVTQ